jgi:hypothetical protein
VHPWNFCVIDCGILCWKAAWSPPLSINSNAFVLSLFLNTKRYFPLTTKRTLSQSFLFRQVSEEHKDNMPHIKETSNWNSPMMLHAHHRRHLQDRNFKWQLLYMAQCLNAAKRTWQTLKDNRTYSVSITGWEDLHYRGITLTVPL